LEAKGTTGRLTTEGHYDAKKNVTKIEDKMSGEEDNIERKGKEKD
jgi:hypothetical protein